MTGPVVRVLVAAVSIASASIGDGPGPRVAMQRLVAEHPGVATLDVSADGRYVAFVSSARLATADVNSLDDVYVLDRFSGGISLESVAVDGGASNGTSAHPRLSADGRILVFTSVATNLAEGARGPLCSQVMRRDRAAGATALVSRTPAHAPGNGTSHSPDVNDDGRFVVFESGATDLVAGPDANASRWDIYLFDAARDAVSRVSLTSDGGQSPIGSGATPGISGTGQYVVFSSTAPLDAPVGLQPGQAQPRAVFLRDVASGTTRRVSRTRDGRVPNGPSYHPAISADGSRIAFVSTATDLGDGHWRHPSPHVFLYDVATTRVTLASRNAKGRVADGASSHPVVSADGRYVVFSSDASNLVCARRGPIASDDVNLVADVYRLDTRSDLVQRVSGPEPGPPWFEQSAGPAVDATGRVIAYSSRHPIDDADVRHDDDLFIEVLPDPPAPDPGSTTAPTRRQSSGTPASRWSPGEVSGSSSWPASKWWSHPAPLEAAGGALTAGRCPTDR
jgi:TolB protein